MRPTAPQHTTPQDGLTPVWSALVNGRDEVLEVLLKGGANKVRLGSSAVVPPSPYV